MFRTGRLLKSCSACLLCIGIKVPEAHLHKIYSQPAEWQYTRQPQAHAKRCTGCKQPGCRTSANLAVPERAMVPRLLSSSSRVMPTPVSLRKQPHA